MIRRAIFIVSLWLTSQSLALDARDLNSVGAKLLNWHPEHIARVVSGGDYVEGGGLATRDARQCVEGSRLNFDVSDDYAFDIDEPVRLQMKFYLGVKESTAYVLFEKSGNGEMIEPLHLPAYQHGSHIYRTELTLDRARFANRGWAGTDFSIGAGPNPGQSAGWEEGKVVVCGLALTRSHQTKIAHQDAGLDLIITDETGKATPARVGLYDAIGRFPLPSREAITIKRWTDPVPVRSTMLDARAYAWPAHDPSIFYTSGQYHTQLPASRYELVVAKGPEYRISRQSFEVHAGPTQAIKVKLNRWDDLPAKGWFSGDDHVHFALDGGKDDAAVRTLMQAEDIHVANVLQFGNYVRPHFSHFNWRLSGDLSDTSYILVPGLEDPRTARLGHTLFLNLPQSIRPAPEQYLLYEKVFKRARELGAVTGFSHILTDSGPAGGAGLALEASFGLVDVAEVLQFGNLNSKRLFDFWNMGYKLAPSAGTDYPDARFPFVPGAERVYVRVEKPLTSQRWFEALKRGEDFVTNGPMLSFTVNGVGMGSELHLKSGQSLVIDAVSTLNPDLDTLDRLELIEQGEVIKSATSDKDSSGKLVLHFEAPARHGTWFAVRAYGKRPQTAAWHMNSEAQAASMALSGGIFVYVDGKNFWKPSAVPGLVTRFKQELKDLLISERDHPESCCELWETRAPSLKYWDAQKEPLEARVNQAIARYDDLAKRVAAESAP